jgi:hyperosmotically inducible protein
MLTKIYGARLWGILSALLLLSFIPVGTALAGTSAISADSIQRLSGLNEKVRHELVMLPFFGVFDNLEFSVDNSNVVVLTGQVYNPTLKSDAEKRINRIEGVTKVVNNIEILPVSHFDDVIRWRAYRAIYSNDGFEKYSIMAISPIRIVVKNGHVTLNGVVVNQMDKTVAGMAVNSVPGVFSVTNNLMVH